MANKVPLKIDKLVVYDLICIAGCVAMLVLIYSNVLGFRYHLSRMHVVLSEWLLDFLVMIWTVCCLVMKR